MIKVLVLDDEKGLCKDLKDFFDYRGYKVFAATSGEQALSFVKKESIDILVLDIKMEGVDGLKVLKEAKEKDSRVKAIMITALRDENKKRQAFDLGANEYITKPFNYDKVESAIIHLVNEILKEREAKK